MKKLMSLLVLASFAMILVGCGEGEKKKVENTTKSTVTKPDDKDKKDAK